MKPLVRLCSTTSAVLSVLIAVTAIAGDVALPSAKFASSRSEHTLEVPPNAMAGSRIQVRWSGPPGRVELLHTDGTPVDQHDQVSARHRGSTATLAVPEVPGDYQVRYRPGTIRAEPLSALLFVYPVGFAIGAPHIARAGEQIEVRWLGPAHEWDYISLTGIGAGVNEWYDRALVDKRRVPVRLRVPDRPGRYELRYVLARTGSVLSARELNVPAESASLEVADMVAADRPVEVRWTGPGQPGDFIAIREPTDDLRIWHTRRQVSGNEGRVWLRAPHEPGRYELHYQDGNGGAVSAVAVLRVRPGRH